MHHTAINLKLKSIEKVEMASVILYNFLNLRSTSQCLSGDAFCSENIECGTNNKYRADY